MRELPADWFLLFLRLLFVFLLYFFLYQLFRVQLRQLLSVSAPSENRRDEPSPSGARLVVASKNASGPSAGTAFPLQPISTIGRHPDCTVHVDDPSTSATHAEIRLSGRQWWIVDLNSTNGTFVNGARLQGPMRIEAGDVVQFGGVQTDFVR